MKQKKTQLLNLKGVPCPHNFTRALILLEGMDEGELLDIIVDSGEPLKNVPQALEEEGHIVISIKENSDTTWTICSRSAC